MAKYSEIIEGLQILGQYEDPEKAFAEFGHDILWVTVGDFSDEDMEAYAEDNETGDAPVPRDRRLSDKHQARLVELDWHVDEENACWAIF